MAANAPQIAIPVEKGSPHPLGATPGPEGVNFSLFSGNATGVELLLFRTHAAPQPFQVISTFRHCPTFGTPVGAVEKLRTLRVLSTLHGSS